MAVEQKMLKISREIKEKCYAYKRDTRKDEEKKKELEEIMDLYEELARLDFTEEKKRMLLEKIYKEMEIEFRRMIQQEAMWDQYVSDVARTIERVREEIKNYKERGFPTRAFPDSSINLMNHLEEGLATDINLKQAMDVMDEKLQKLLKESRD